MMDKQVAAFFPFAGFKQCAVLVLFLVIVGPGVLGHGAGDHDHPPGDPGMPMPQNPSTTTSSSLTAPTLAPSPSSQPPSGFSALNDFCNQPSSKAFGACNLYSVCRSKSSNDKYCHPVSILNSLCGVDKVSAAVCNDWKSSSASSAGCAVNGVKCSDYPAWPQMVNSSAIQNEVFAVCSSHSMSGCEQCRKPSNFNVGTPSTLADCPSLQVYAKLCNAMPKMQNCGGWAQMCRAYPNSVTALPEICDKDAVSIAPASSSPVGGGEGKPSSASRADLDLLSHFVRWSVSAMILSSWIFA